MQESTRNSVAMKKIKIGDTVYAGERKTPFKVAKVIQINCSTELEAFLYCIGPRNGTYKFALQKDGKLIKL